MHVFFFYFLISLILLIAFSIGISQSHRKSSIQDYFLGGKNFSMPQLTLTILASQLGGGILLGGSEFAYTYGWRALSYAFGASLGLLLMGFFYAEKLQKLQKGTIAQVLGEIYQSHMLQKIVSLFSIFTIICILIGSAVAMKKLFGFIGANNGLFLLVWTAFVFYTVLGGLRAVVFNDMFQVLSILSIIFFFVVFVFFKLDRPIIGPLVDFKGASMPILDWICMPALSVFLSQDIAQRCFASVNPKSIKQAMLRVPFLLFVTSVIPVALGILATKEPMILFPQKSLFLIMSRELSNPWIASLMTAAVLMSIINTGDSLLCALGSNLGYDFRLKGRVEFIQYLTFAIGCLVALLAFFVSDILPVMIFGYQISVCVLIVPFVAGLSFGISSKLAAYGSMIFSGVLYVLNFWLEYVPSLIIVLLGAVVFIAFFLGERFLKPSSKI